MGEPGEYCERECDHVLRYLPLYRAALTDDWKTAETIFNEDPDADTAKITYWGETALQIAVGTNSSHRFVDKLVNRIAAKDIAKLRNLDYMSNNSLHYAAKVGNTMAAKVIVDMDPEMTMIPNRHGSTAVKLAAWYGRKETLVYLLRVTRNEVGVDGTSPYSGVAGGDLITLTITAGFYDIALKLMTWYPNLVTQKDRNNLTALETLAAQPSDFPSGRSWWFCKYFCTPLNSALPIEVDSPPNSTQMTEFHTPLNNLIETELDVNLNSENSSSRTWMETPCGKVCFGFCNLISRVAQYLGVIKLDTPLNSTVVTVFNTPINNTIETPLDVNLNSEKSSSRTWMEIPCGKVCFGFNIFISSVAQYLVPWPKNMHETKRVHKQTNQLMKAMIKAILIEGSHKKAWEALGPAMFTAAKHGIHEIVEECLRRYPGLIWYKDNDGLYLFLAAIKHRQVKVYNLVYQMTGHRVFLATNMDNEVGDNALHLAGRKVSPDRLNTVTGAALQMQRELQWFKEVEKFVEPSYKEALNKENKTPRMVFTDDHKDLVKKGEKWMKDTASSSTLVAALIVTVSFAAIFTLPGVNKSDGTPNFLRDSTFVLFAISDAVALFSSVTSVLLFLSMLTSRYAEDAFLHALPKRLTIGLLSLFISILAIMLTFSAALVLVLRKKVSWIAIPVGLIACVPVTFFALLQFPRLVELVLSTFGPNIFHKQNNLILH